MSEVVQTIRAFVKDHMLEPDALRGSEHVLKDLEVNDEEQARRDAHAEAISSKGPIRLTSGETTTPAMSIAPSIGSNAANEQWARDNGWKAPDRSDDPRYDTSQHSDSENRTEAERRGSLTFDRADRSENETRSPDRLMADPRSDAPDKTPYSADARPIDSSRSEYASGNLTPNTPNPPPATPNSP